MGATTAVMLMLVAAHTHAWSSKKVCKYDEWLNKPCSAQADCKVKMAECFKGRCLCTPGYYYSISGNTCVEHCPVSDQLSEFLAYPDSYMDVPPVELPADNVEDCLDTCAADSSCITVEFYFPAKKCYTNSLSPRLDPSKLITSFPGSVLYQQQCA